MLMKEFNFDEVMAVRYEDGIIKGRAEGMERGRANEREDIARNALAKGASVEFVHEITGLDTEAIENIQSMEH